ncbi:phosphatase PAP2 family protein [Chitinophaga japonensis]|uniref:Membrane-associated phospholipid phosphatase n=1 Tax=Chitinophaga japonensis TaxID=104662 RepID=A0A562SZ12_CHIJA|nr:phosphatase PAP2 family protein [Chitinophaga japonensis]TWI86565.1 membrane-associated phospholipid phosphatase [Chitinophaga japonensis]
MNLRLIQYLHCCLLLTVPLFAIAQTDSSYASGDSSYVPGDTLHTAAPATDTIWPVPDSIINYRINGAYLRSYVDDFKFIVGRPARWTSKDLTRLGIVLGATGLLMAGDHEIKQFFSGNRTKSINSVSGQIEPFGNTYGPLLLGGMYLAGVVTRERPLEHASLMATKSLIISTLFYTATKAIIRRQRPAFTNDPFSYNAPFSMDKRFTSFPSGHMHTVMTIATALAEVYGKDHPWVPWVAYSIAGLTGVSRLYDNRHWSSDVWIGASLGYFVTKTVFKRHRQLLKKHTYNPLVAP